MVYPIDLVKTRVQRDALSGIENRESAMQIFRRLRKGGIARLYKGLGVSASRSALSKSVSFFWKE
jgi:solute carrier family 25 carnitine/acylcarnitine transporter 20/29